MSAERLRRRFADLRKALHKGDHAALDVLTKRIEQDISAIEAGTLSKETIADLRIEAGRHADLILAARDGIRAARSRIIALQTDPGLRTYSRDGTARNAASPATPGLSRKS